MVCIAMAKTLPICPAPVDSCSCKMWEGGVKDPKMAPWEEWPGLEQAAL